MAERKNRVQKILPLSGTMRYTETNKRETKKTPATRNVRTIPARALHKESLQRKTEPRKKTTV